MTQRQGTLAERLGTTVHESPLRRKLLALQSAFPAVSTAGLEDWLIDVANARGATVVIRPTAPAADFVPPPGSRLSNEELVAGICLLQGLDRPQMLRLAAQLLSRGVVVVERLALVARRERVGSVLVALARAALRVEPEHPTWRAVLAAFHDEPPLRDVLLHWTRLAEPVPQRTTSRPPSWRLVA